MRYRIITFLLGSLFAFSAQAQDWNSVIKDIPMAKYNYPASRNRDKRPSMDSPRAWVFAYYNLPYAIDLTTYDDNSDGVGFRVKLSFSSANLSKSEERDMLKRALPKLQTLIDQLGERARQAERNSNSYSGSSSQAAISAHGDAMMANRESQCANNLFRQLSNRLNSL